MSIPHKQTFAHFPFIEYEDFNAIVFNVIQLNDGNMNLILDMMNLDDNDSGEDFGLTLRTTIYGDSLVELAKYVKSFLDLGMFNTMTYIPNSACMDQESEVKYEFSWDDYILEENNTLN
jgi:hypothetical protein